MAVLLLLSVRPDEKQEGRTKNGRRSRSLPPAETRRKREKKKERTNERTKKGRKEIGDRTGANQICRLGNTTAAAAPFCVYSTPGRVSLVVFCSAFQLTRLHLGKRGGNGV